MKRLFNFLTPALAITAMALSAETAICEEPEFTGPVQPYATNDVPEKKTDQLALTGTSSWLNIDLLAHPSWKPVSAPPGLGQISGEIPVGLDDNSSWAQVKIHYSRDVEEGLPFLRWNVTEITQGWAQMAANLPSLSQPYYLRFQLKARALKATPVSFGVRDMGTPWQYVWSRDMALDSAWKDVVFDAIVEPAKQPVGLFIKTAFLNRIDIASFSLEALPISAVKKEAAGTDRTPPENLLRDSRFPLGLPAGANVDVNTSIGDDLEVVSDPTRLGIGNWPSLKLATKNTPVSPFVVLEPFAVDTILKPYIISLSAVGNGVLSLRLVENGNQVASQDFHLDPKDPWRRLSLTYDKFKPGFPYQIELVPHGTVWVDAVQVASGTDPAYLSPDRPEVALAAANLSRVYLEGEPATVHYQVTGKTDGLKLRVKVVDVYQEQHVLKDIPLSTASLQGKIPFDVFPGRSYGDFRIEAWLVDAQGKAASAGFETTALRVRSPRYMGQDAPDSPFGVHTTPSRSLLEMAKRVGVNWVRLHDAGLECIGWNYLEPSPGKWQFRDKEISRYRDAKLMILGELGTSPAWASNLSKIGRHDAYYDQFYQPNKLSDFANYARTVGQHYRDQITHWDVWNEPWNHPWWAVAYNKQLSGEAAYQTSEHAQSDYAALSKTAFTTMKSVDQSEQVGGIASTTGSPAAYAFGGTEWARGVMDAGGLNTSDMATYHCYFSGSSLYPGDPVESGLHTALGPLMDSAGKVPRPIWMTEGSSIVGMMKTGFYHFTLPLPLPEDYDTTSDYLCRYEASLLANGVTKIFVYSMHGYTYMALDPQWSVLTVEDGSPHPSGAAFSNLAYWLDGTKFQSRVAPDSSVGVYLYAGAGRTVAIFARRQGCPSSYTLPVKNGLTYYDLYGNSVSAGTTVPSTLVYGVTTDPATDIQSFLAGK